jgi:hypothetical protein
MNSGALVSTPDDAAAQFAATPWPPTAATLAAVILLLLLKISDWPGAACAPPSASAARHTISSKATKILARLPPTAAQSGKNIPLQ